MQIKQQYCCFFFFYITIIVQGCALAEPGGPWRLTFALDRLENLRLFIQIICRAPWILQVQSIGLLSIFLRAQPWLLQYLRLWTNTFQFLPSSVSNNQLQFNQVYIWIAVYGRIELWWAKCNGHKFLNYNISELCFWVMVFYSPVWHFSIAKSNTKLISAMIIPRIKRKTQSLPSRLQQGRSHSIHPKTRNLKGNKHY